MGPAQWEKVQKLAVEWALVPLKLAKTTSHKRLFGVDGLMVEAVGKDLALEPAVALAEVLVEDLNSSNSQ